MNLSKEYSCDRKTQYKDRKQAIRTMDFIRRKQKNKEPINLYKCAYCIGWHIGHPTSVKTLINDDSEWIELNHRAYERS